MKVTVTEDQIGLIESALYRVDVEDGEALVYDTQIAAYLGKDVWVLKGFVSKGWGEHCSEDEGCVRYVRHGAKQEAAEFAARIVAKGLIDTTHWEKLPPAPSWAEREAYNLRCEDEERLGW